MINRAITKVVLGAILISTSAPWVRLADVSPSTAGFYRMLIGGICLLLICLYQKKRLWNGTSTLLILLPPAIFFALDLAFWHRSIHLIGPGLATLLANLQVFFLAAIGFIFLKEKLNGLFFIGLIMAFIGVFFLIGLDNSFSNNNNRLGVFFGVLTALSYTGFILTMRKRQPKGALCPASNLVTVSLLCSALLATLIAFEGNSYLIPDTKSVIALLMLGVFCQAIGWLFITTALPELSASLVGVILLLQPALAMLWDTLFFGRATSWIDVVGSAMVLAGIYLTTLITSNKNQLNQA